MNEQLRRLSPAGALARKIATMRELSFSDLALVIVCWLMLGTLSLLIAIVPSRRILRTLGPNFGAVEHSPVINLRQRRRAQRIARAIAIAARNAPFRADCYPQALTAAQLCRWFSIPHAVQLGARLAAVKSDLSGKLEGHAWVNSGSVTVCGGPASAAQFGTVACFVHVPRPTDRDAIG